jgi:hypothetical protein
MRRPPRNKRTRIAIVALVIATAAGGVRVTMAAFTDQTGNVGNGATSLTLGTTTSVTAAAAVTSAADSLCKANNIDISWNAVTNADSYRVQVQANGGSWSDVNAETGNVLSIADPNTYQGNETLVYRVYARLNSPDWEGSIPQLSTAIQCGVIDLTSSQLCNNNVTLNWTGGAGSNRWDIQVSTNGGSSYASLATNQSLSGPNYTYSAATNYTDGQDVRWQVRPGYGTSADYGSWSNGTTQLEDSGQSNWQNFRMISATIGGDADKALEAGETITMTFSKPVDPTSITINSIRTNASSTYIQLASTANNTYEIGRIVTNNVWTTTANYAGSYGWTDANRTLTWTKGAGSTANFQSAAATASSWTRSTDTVCAADGASTLATSATSGVPPIAGRF